MAVARHRLIAPLRGFGRSRRFFPRAALRLPWALTFAHLWCSSAQRNFKKRKRRCGKGFLRWRFRLVCSTRPPRLCAIQASSVGTFSCCIVIASQQWFPWLKFAKRRCKTATTPIPFQRYQAMEHTEMQRRLRETPFQPFRVFVRDGRQYDIRHPRMNLLGHNFIKIGIPALDLRPPICDHTEYVALKDIERVEPLPPPPPPQTF